MSGPTLSIWRIETQVVQGSAGVGFEVIHYLNWRRFGVDDSVNMIGANMGGEENPIAMGADFYDSRQNSVPTCLIEDIGRLIHALQIGGYAG